MSSSVGIEIELPWTTMLSRVDTEAAEILKNSNGFWTLDKKSQSRVQEGFNALDSEFRERVDQAFTRYSIVPGNDGFAEFALNPSFSLEETLDTVECLYQEEILIDRQVYPLHVTFGGVTANLSWIALMAMEICDGVKPERLTQKTTWSRKGSAGILERKPEELLIDNKAVEFRTLQLTDQEQLQKIMILGKTICDSLVDSKTNEVNELKTFLISSLFDMGLDATYQWPNPQKSIKPWLKMSELLKDTNYRRQLSDEIFRII